MLMQPIRQRESASLPGRPGLFYYLGLYLKSGQPMCYRTGQVYVSLTAPSWLCCKNIDSANLAAQVCVRAKAMANKQHKDATKPFKWKYTVGEIILWLVSWVSRYALSYRDLKEIAA